MSDLEYLRTALMADRFDPSCPLRGGLDANPLTLIGLRRLMEMGVPRAFLGELTGAGDLGAAQVDLTSGGSRFAFGGPTGRLLLAVRAGDGTLVDMAALSSACEDEWALLSGGADLLGEWLLEDAIAAERRELRLFPTPMAWLRGGGRGICVLDWTPAALGALRGLRSHQTLVVDPGAKVRLDAMLAYGGLPMVAEERAAIRRVA